MGVIKRQGIKNTIINYIGVVIGAISIIFIQPKLLSEEEMGLTRLLFDFASMIGILVPLGLPNIIVKYFPFFKNREEGHNGFASVILGIFFTGFVISISLLLLFKNEILSLYDGAEGAGLLVRYFIFVIPFTFVVSAITITTVYCQSLFKSTIPAFLNDICIRVGLILITILYSQKIISFDWFVYSYIGIYVLELLVIIVYLFIIDRVSFRVNRELLGRHSLKKMLRFGLLLCFASLASFALRKIDGLILSTYSLKLVAVYTTAVYIASFIEVPLGALDKITHTKIAEGFAKGNLPEVEKIYRDSVKYLLVIGGLLFIGITACTKYLYQAAGLPPSFEMCIDVVYIVSFGALINISTGVNSALMSYSNFYVAGTFFLVLTLVITFTLNVILVKYFGIYGAAFASLAGSLISNFIKFYFIYHKFRFQPYDKKSLMVVALMALCSLAGYFLPEYPGHALINLLYKGALLSALYIFVVYKLEVVPELFNGIFSNLFVKKRNQ